MAERQSPTRDPRGLSWPDYREQVRTQARAAGIPAFGTFEITPLCNFDCKMCYVHLSPARMRELGRLRTADEWVDLARQARDLGTIWLTLTGGEVLTCSDFPQIYARISDLGILVSVLSNGSLITDDVVRLFVERPPVYLRFTLYGASNETYERLCGVPDGFDRVMAGLRKLKAANVDFAISFTETSLNIGDYDAVMRIAESLEVEFRPGTELVGAVRGAKSNAAELRDFTPRTQTQEKLAPMAIPAANAATVAPWKRGDNPFERCRSYRSSFWVCWDGTMEMCAFMSSCGAKPFEIGMNGAWRKLLEHLDTIQIPVACEGCDLRAHCFSCPGVREAETGSAELVCERLCDRARKTSERLAQMRIGVMADEESLRDPHDATVCD